MAKKSRPPSPPASISEEEEASSDEEQPPSTSKPEPQTPTKNKYDEGEDEESEDKSKEESEGEDEESEDKSKEESEGEGEGEDEESEDESKDDDDEEEPGSDNRKPQPSAAASAPVPAPSKPASDSVSGSESEDDSDSEAATAKLVTPISSRPMADGPVVKETDDGEKPNGKPFFQRIWTQNDEIAVLNAMAGFQLEHGPIKMSPTTIGDFLGFVKDSLSIGVSSALLVDKLRRLKKKYSVVAARAKNDEKGLKFMTAHDQVVYELSKKVWGKEEGDDEREMVANGKANSVVTNGRGKRGYPLLKEAVAEIKKKTGNRLVVEALEMIESEKASVLEKKLKKQRMAEIKHNMHELDLLKETLKLIMEGAERAVD